MKSLLVLFMGLVIQAPWAGAVSQIGGGKCYDKGQGYWTPIPQSLAQGSGGGNGALTLLGRSVFGLGTTTTADGYEFAILYDLTVYKPDVAKIENRDEFIRYWTAEGWHLESSVDPCLVKMRRDKYSLVLGWGPGHGLELGGQRVPDVANGLDEFAQGIHLAPGACTWK